MIQHHRAEICLGNMKQSPHFLQLTKRKQMRLLLKSKIDAAAVILNTRHALLIGFAGILILLTITTANFVILNAITVLPRRDGHAFSPRIVTTISVWKVTVLITSTITVSGTWGPVSPVTIAEMRNTRPPRCGSLALI